MKKSKLLAGVLVASMALMGTGYAYWTDKLTVQGTVATGKLEVNYVTGTSTSIGERNETEGKEGTQPQYGDYLQLTPSQWDKDLDGCYPWNDSLAEKHTTQKGKVGHTIGLFGAFVKGKLDNCPTCTPTHQSNYRKQVVTPGTDPVAGGEIIATQDTKKAEKSPSGYITNVTATASGKGVTINMDNFYPGSFASTVFTAKNDGSIPAVLDTVKLTNIAMSAADGENFADKLKVLVTVSAPGDTATTFSDLTDGDLAQADSISKIDTLLKTACGDLILEPGKMVTIRLAFVFPGQTKTGSQFESLTGQTFNLDLNWRQHNALPTKTTTTPSTTAPTLSAPAPTAETTAVSPDASADETATE